MQTIPKYNLQSYSATAEMQNTLIFFFFLHSHFILKAIIKNRTSGREPRLNSWRKRVLCSEKYHYLQCSPKDRLIQSVEHFFNSLPNFTLFMKITQYLRKTNQSQKPFLTVLSTFKKHADVVSFHHICKTKEFSILWKMIKLKY